MQDDDTDSKLADLRLSLLSALNVLCNCRLTDEHITDEELSCRGGLQNQIVYRGRIKGNSYYSSEGLVDLMQAWALSRHASVMVGISRLEVDPTCPVFMDNINAPDCASSGRPPSPPSPGSETDERDKSDDGLDGGEIGGIVIGTVIAILLLVLIAIAIIFIARVWKPNGATR